MKARSTVRACGALFCLVRSLDARAAAPDAEMFLDAERPRATAASETPLIAFTHSAFGVASGVTGGSGYGVSRGGFQSEDSLAVWGGGVRIWGAPVERMTLYADAERRDEGGNNRFAPSASVALRVLGDRAQGFALAALARYKAEAFAELGGEVEGAALFSYDRRGVYLDTNAVVGAAFEEEESDAELLARIGYELTPFLRAGAEGRVRQRLSGAASLPGGRTWDALLGPQVIAHHGVFLASLTLGPSTVGVSASVGWIAIATLGGVAF